MSLRRELSLGILPDIGTIGSVGRVALASTRSWHHAQVAIRDLSTSKIDFKLDIRSRAESRIVDRLAAQCSRCRCICIPHSHAKRASIKKTLKMGLDLA